MSDQIPPEVKQFIRERVHSLEELEVLLLLFRDPDKQWTPEAVNDTIRSSISSIRARLADLVEKGLASVVPDKSNHYRADTAQFEHVIHALEQAYRDHRIQIVQAIFEDSMANVRSFARAFKVKRDKDG